MNRRYERLRQTLTENGEPLDDIELLAELATVLDAIPDPVVRQERKNALLLALVDEMPQPKTRLQMLLEWYPFALLLSQIRVIQREIWPASALVLLVGVLTVLAMPTPDYSFFSTLAPVVSVVGIALIYGDDVMLMLELEETTLATARILLLARLTLIFCFNLFLALAGSIILATVSEQLSLIPLVAQWLAPMSFLSALAFFLAIATGNSLAAAAFSLTLWVTHITFYTPAFQTGWLYYLSLPGFAEPVYRPLMIAGAFVIVGLTLWMVGIRERQIPPHMS